MATFEEDMIEIDTITLPMEDGTDQEFAILDNFEFEEKSYIVVAAIDGEDIGEDLFIYGYAEDGDDIIIDYIEDDALYTRIADAYNAMVDEEDDEEEDGE